jgi:hypothetical protein
MRPSRNILPIPMLLVLACGFSTQSTAIDFKDLTRVGVFSPSAADCGKCHITIYEEWLTSPHAHSYVSEDYVEATRMHTFEKCLGCHAPLTVFNSGIPTKRPHRPEEGVTCITCHLKDDAMAGPVKSSALVHPHPVTVDKEFYYSSDFCGKCHVGTVEEAKANGATNTCQECHMPAVVRKTTQATGAMSKILVAFEDRVPGRKHGFSLHDMTTPVDKIQMTLSTAPGTNGQMQVVVTMTHSLPHGIPTGDYGFRQATLAITALNHQGDASARSEENFYKELKTSLLPGKEYIFTMPLPRGTYSAEAELFRTGRDGKNRVQITQASLQISGEKHTNKAAD